MNTFCDKLRSLFPSSLICVYVVTKPDEPSSSVADASGEQQQKEEKVTYQKPSIVDHNIMDFEEHPNKKVINLILQT